MTEPTARYLDRVRQGTTPALAYNQTISRLIGARIRALRLERGWTLAELADRAGLVSCNSKNRMWEIENAKRRQGMRLGTLYALAVALDVEVSELMPSTAEIVGVAT